MDGEQEKAYLVADSQHGCVGFHLLALGIDARGIQGRLSLLAYSAQRPMVGNCIAGWRALVVDAAQSREPLEPKDLAVSAGFGPISEL